MKKNINISEVKINYQLLSKFPAEFLIKNLFFPLEEKDGTIAIAMPDIDNLAKIGMIENFTRKKVLPFYANKGDLEKFLKKSDTYTKVLRDKTETFAVKKTDATVEDDVVTIESITEEDDSVVKLLNNFLSFVQLSCNQNSWVSSDELLKRPAVTRPKRPINKRPHPRVVTHLAVVELLDKLHALVI